LRETLSLLNPSLQSRDKVARNAGDSTLPTTILVQRSLLSRSNLRKVVYNKVQVNISTVYIGIWDIELQRVASTRQPFNGQHSGCIRFFKSSPWPITIHTATTQLVTSSASIPQNVPAMIHSFLLRRSLSMRGCNLFLFLFYEPTKTHAWFTG